MVPQLMTRGRHDSQPKVTFYLTLVFEHYGAEQYTYSIDRCYPSLAQANDRLGLLSRCNTSAISRETLRVGEDQDTGCQWCAWTQPGHPASNFRFYAEVKRVVMDGAIRRDGPIKQDSTHVASGLASTAEFKYSFEHNKDLANHVWTVALHNPEWKIVIDREGRPTQLPWALEGVYEASGNAMARGKRLWRDSLAQKQGRFDRLDSHQGFARYLLVPQATNAAMAGSSQKPRSREAVPRIRVERVRVMAQGEMVAMFAPAEAILFDKPFQPLYKGREQDKAREAAAKVKADLLDLFAAAGEEDVEQYDAVPPDALDSRELTPPPICRVSLRSPQKQSFCPGVVQENKEMTATFREPVAPPSPTKAKKAKDRMSISKGVVSARKHFYHSLVKGNLSGKLTEANTHKTSATPVKTIKRKPAIMFDDIKTTVVPPTTPSQAALAAQQTLWLASRVNRG